MDLVDSYTVSGTVGTVTLTGMDSTYDVYCLIINGLTQTSGTTHVYRFQASGTDLTGSNYNKTGQKVAVGSIADVGDQNIAWLYPDNSASGSAPFSTVNYIYNANVSNAYTLMTIKAISTNANYILQGGGLYKVETATDGISIHAYNTTVGDGTFSGGNFQLFGLPK